MSNMRGQLKALNAVLIALVVILAIVAAYGWLRPTTAPQSTGTLTLEQAAMQEGQLTIYGVIDSSDFVNIIQAFVTQYPWAKGEINYVGLSPSQIPTRALSEYQAGKVQADLLIDTLAPLIPFIQAGAAANCNNPMISLMNYTTGTYDNVNYTWCPAYWLPIVIIYNIPKLQALGLQPPTSWSDLANPKLKGLIAIDDPKVLNVAGTLFASLYPLLGNSSWTSLMNGIKANNPIITDSAGTSYTKVASGDAVVGVGLINDYLEGLAQGAPVGVAWINPIFSLPIATVLTKNAPHPAFAKLFLEWFLSGAGQLSLVKVNRVPMNLIIAKSTILKIMPSGFTIETAGYNVQGFYTNPTKWQNIFQSIFG